MLHIENPYELEALLRALVSAKFTEDPLDDDVPASPLVADVVKRVCAALEESEVASSAEAAARVWTEWISLDPDRLEWQAALKYAKRAFAAKWPTWERAEREHVVRDLLAPFEVGRERLDAFIEEVSRPP